MCLLESDKSEDHEANKELFFYMVGVQWLGFCIENCELWVLLPESWLI